MVEIPDGYHVIVSILPLHYYLLCDCVVCLLSINPCVYNILNVKNHVTLLCIVCFATEQINMSAHCVKGSCFPFVFPCEELSSHLILII